MYEERKLEIEGLKDKQHFIISSIGNKKNFNSSKMRVTIYYDDSNYKGDEFFAQRKVYENRQKNTYVIHVPIPFGVNKASIIFATNLKSYDLNDLTAVA